MRCLHELDGESTTYLGSENSGETVRACWLCHEQVEPNDPYDDCE